MKRWRKSPGILALLLVAGNSIAADFSGKWSIDLRTPAQRERKAECGFAEFTLVQTKDQVEGSHSFYTTDCGRINEGGPGTVKGFVADGRAILVVTSGRNSEMALGVATLEGEYLRWQVKRELRPGEPEGDSGLILAKGQLLRVKTAAQAQPNTSLERTRDR
jgi:hypothetical protein